MTDSLSDVSFHLSLCSGWCFVNTGFCLLKLSTVVSELLLCCCAVTEHVSAWKIVWCLDWPETVFRLVFLLLLCSLRHTISTSGPNNGLHFFCFSFERHWRHFTVQRHLLRTCLTHCLSRYTEICWRLKSDLLVEISRLIDHHFAKQARNFDILHWVDIEIT